MRNMAKEMGHNLETIAQTDSSAARGPLMRSGSGRLKHVSLDHLWIQEKAANAEVRFDKISRDFNSADLMTHHWSRCEGDAHLARMSAEVT